MRVLTAANADRTALAEAFSAPARIIVVALCAAWCDTCGEFRTAYERMAARRLDATFVWLDIEDDEAIVGDIDVENFPTLAIFRGTLPLHFGVSLPHETTIIRLVDALARDAAPAAASIDDAARRLPSRLLDRPPE
jgi:thioredoxin reductase (NADPH)